MFSTEIVWKIEKFKIEKIMKIKKGSNKKIVFSRPLENYVMDIQIIVLDMYFVETKFLYKNHVLDLNLKNENMFKNQPRKQKKCQNE